MKIYLIRHGQTTGDIEDRYGGTYDDHLTIEGELQAKKLAEKLKDSNIEILFYSPLLRAKETALKLQTTLQCKLEAIDKLRERNRNGIITGMTRKEAKSKYPQLVELLKNDHNTVSGAEKYDDFKHRILLAWKEILSHKYSTIGIVTHGGPIKIILNEILGLDIKKTEDCGYVILEKTDNQVTLTTSDGVYF